MNILWLTHPESDYASSMLVDAFTGRNSPATRIDFYPHKWQYFGETHRYELPMIMNGCTAPAPWMEPVPDSLVDLRGSYAHDTGSHYGVADGPWLDSIAKRLENDEYDLIVLESQRMHVNVAITQLNLEHWVVKHRTPVVLLDGEDYTDLRLRLFNLRVDLVLKREYTKDISPSDSCIIGDGYGAVFVKAFPFMTTRRMVEQAVRTPRPELVFDCDASLLVGDTFPVRGDVARELEKAHKAGYLRATIGTNIPSFQGGYPLLPWEEYIKTARLSLCTIVPRGFGYDTLRFWELLPATILIAQRTELILPNTFSHAHDIFWWDTPEQCIEMVRQLVMYPPNLQASIFVNAQTRMQKYHTADARMAILMRDIENVISAKQLRGIRA